jgi:hypothetical protein
MNLTAALLAVPPPRHGSTVADVKARRTARTTNATNGPIAVALEPVSKPWRWNPARHERMRASRSD